MSDFRPRNPLALAIAVLGLCVMLVGPVSLAAQWQMSAVLGGCALVLAAALLSAVDAVQAPVAARA